MDRRQGGCETRGLERYDGIVPRRLDVVPEVLSHLTG